MQVSKLPMDYVSAERKSGAAQTAPASPTPTAMCSIVVT